MANPRKDDDTKKDQFTLHEGSDRSGKSLLPEATKALVEHLDKTEPLGSSAKRIAISGKSDGKDVYFVGQKEPGTGKNVDVTHMIDSTGKTHKLSSKLTVAFEGRSDETAHHILSGGAAKLQTLQDTKELNLGGLHWAVSKAFGGDPSYYSLSEIKVPPKQQISAVLGIPVPVSSGDISVGYNAVGNPVVPQVPKDVAAVPGVKIP